MAKGNKAARSSGVPEVGGRHSRIIRSPKFRISDACSWGSDFIAIVWQQMPVAFLKTPPVCRADQPLPHGSLEICKEAAFVRPLVRICENTYTHVVSLFQNAGCQPKCLSCMHLRCFSNAIGLNAHVQISDHQMVPATTSRCVNICFDRRKSFRYVEGAACLPPLHRSHVQYSLIGGASGMP